MRNTRIVSHIHIIFGILVFCVYFVNAIPFNIRQDIVETRHGLKTHIYSTLIYNGREAAISAAPNGLVSDIDGLNGLLYSMSDPQGCRADIRNHPHFSQGRPNLALISVGKCDIGTYIEQARLDGAVGALIYRRNMGVTHLKKIIMKKKIIRYNNVPLTLIDDGIGISLQAKLDQVNRHNVASSRHKPKSILVTVFPRDEGGLNTWEIMLVVLVIFLTLCLAFSMGINFLYFRKSRRRELEEHVGQQFATLPISGLKHMPIEKITGDDLKPNTGVGDVQPPPRKDSLNKKNPTYKLSMELEDELHIEPLSFGVNTKESVKDPRDSQIHTECIYAEHHSNKTCSICIDDFKIGAFARKLPCGHHFHIECVDPWLMLKSSLCPLCKYDTRNALSDDEKARYCPELLLPNISNVNVLVGHDAFRRHQTSQPLTQ
ncbi:hypothetical protein H4219_001330 [Mycoemilia scoparia]|uniref:RING-type domain-containing protein n=1 Tax=Mycoemilia scoparia TaxID=417184 RepID=A0A9W8A3M1_9FUNG|nr:hypothetical protein H4219_001330 [Mycoemilia scoparia]